MLDFNLNQSICIMPQLLMDWIFCFSPLFLVFFQSFNLLRLLNQTLSNGFCFELSTWNEASYFSLSISSLTGSNANQTSNSKSIEHEHFYFTNFQQNIGNEIIDLFTETETQVKSYLIIISNKLPNNYKIRINIIILYQLTCFKL